MEVSHEILRAGCIKFGPLFAEDLRHRESRWGSRRHLAETCTSVDGARHRFWRVVDRHIPVLVLFLQRHRETEAAKTFLVRLLGEDNVPEVIRADRLRSCGATLQESPSVIKVDPQQVIRAARCHNVIEQFHRPTRRQERK